MHPKSDLGQESALIKTLYVYERSGQKDMIVTVRDNVVTKISPD
jgi:hypothetical protein